MRRLFSTQTILWPILSGLLLVTASCGDFQDPPSWPQGLYLSHPSASQAPQDQMGGSESHLTPAYSGAAVGSASLPTSLGMAPGSTDTFAAGTRIDTIANESAGGQLSPPPYSGTTQVSTGGAENIPPWLSPEEPQPAAIGFENRPRTRPVTFTWDSSSSGNVAGFRVYVTTVCTLVQYAFDAGRETQFRVVLPIGQQYVATVTAYNAAGESPSAGDYQFDLL